MRHRQGTVRRATQGLPILVIQRPGQSITVIPAPLAL